MKTTKEQRDEWREHLKDIGPDACGVCDFDAKTYLIGSTALDDIDELLAENWRLRGIIDGMAHRISST